MSNIEVIDENGIPVILPSGATFSVLTNGERDYLVDKIQRYLTDNSFSNVVDLLDIDKLSFQLDGLFGSVSDLSRLYAGQGRQQLCAVVLLELADLSADGRLGSKDLLSGSGEIA